MTAVKSDYQEFNFAIDGTLEDIGWRMKAKLAAIPVPADMSRMTVLDVGCDFGFWSFLAAKRGAVAVCGLDRGRKVREFGNVDIADHNQRVASELGFSGVFFERYNLGKQWPTVGRFDMVFMFSVYHHIYENCGDHSAIFFWLWQNTAPGGVVLWENPVDVTDGVAHHNIAPERHAGYTQDAIIAAAYRYFEVEYVGPALHEPARKVFRFKRKELEPITWGGTVKAGAGGAAVAFNHADGRRIWEIEDILGYRPYPGSLNIELEHDFFWEENYVRARLLDVVDRSTGFNGAWEERPARLYPVLFQGRHLAHVLRFEGETYPENQVELIAPDRLRQYAHGGVTIQCL